MFLPDGRPTGPFAGAVRKATRGLAALLPALAVCGPASTAEVDAAAAVEIRFLDVGEGDAVVIRVPDGRAVVYDGGKDRRRLVRALQAAGVSEVVLVVASHNHSDHVGGLTQVIERYRPRYVLENGIPHHTRRYQEFVAAIDRSGAERLAPVGRVLELGDVRLHVLPPPLEPSWGHNDNSIGVVVELGAFRVSLLGDAEAALHDWWLRSHPGILRGVTVHKASHHGSRRGDLPETLRQLGPRIVVVSTEPGSRYPHADVVRMYEEAGAQVLRTDVHGSVTVRGFASGRYEVSVARCGEGAAAARAAGAACP
jgi:competence protein ComEC